MSAALKSLIPVGFLASFGAPVVYVGTALIGRFLEGKAVDLLLLVTMFASALLFSFIATFGLILAVAAIAKLFHQPRVNTSWLPVGLVCGIAVIVSIRYGIQQGAIFGALAFANVLIFALLSRRLA